jgi:hypothetical protein
MLAALSCIRCHAAETHPMHSGRYEIKMCSAPASVAHCDSHAMQSEMASEVKRNMFSYAAP